MMKSFLKQGEEPSSPITLELYNRELDEAIERISHGEFSTFEELEKNCGLSSVGKQGNLFRKLITISKKIHCKMLRK